MLPSLAGWRLFASCEFLLTACNSPEFVGLIHVCSTGETWYSSSVNVGEFHYEQLLPHERKLMWKLEPITTKSPVGGGPSAVNICFTGAAANGIY